MLCFYTCLSFCPWGGSASVHAWIPIPLGPGSPFGGRPPDQAPFWSRTSLGPGTPLREQTPGTRHSPCTVHAGRYGQQAGGMHPTEMQSCLFCFFYSHGFSSNGTNDFCVWQKLMTPCPLVKISTEFELSNICELHLQCLVVSVSDITGY